MSTLEFVAVFAAGFVVSWLVMSLLLTLDRRHR